MRNVFQAVQGLGIEMKQELNTGLCRYSKRNLQMKNLFRLIIPIVLLCQLGLPLQADTFIKGEFDYYTLALSWQPAFCESKPNKLECQSQHEGQFYAEHFTLHGLWPNVQGDKRHTYEYCQMSKSLIKQYKRKRWCNLPKLDLSKQVREQLSQFMPGYISCLQRHEWYKHGSCSGLSENDYYVVSNQLVELFSKTRFSQYVAKNVGRYVNRKVLLKQFDKEFGQGSRHYLALKCKKVRGISLLTEIRIYLKKELSIVSDFKHLFPEKRLTVRGTCPRRFKIDEVGMAN